MENFHLKYFLAANSCEGFFSAFDKCYKPDGEWRVFIIKGGPGTGKSSFMKHFAFKASEKGENPILCPCSSDPDSLDAVILENKKIVIMDGTAPHTVDPSYPGVCEKILNFGEFWDDSKFNKNTLEIIEITNRNKLLHKTAARYLAAAGKLFTDNYKTALACTDTAKCEAFAERLCRRFIPKSTGCANEWVRFIGGITPKGVISYSDTLEACADTLIIIKDEYASASDIILNYIRSRALKNGYEIISVKNPFLPSLILDHIIIPKLSLCIATENDFTHFKNDTRRIHARRFVSSNRLHLSRERLKFNSKAAKQLLLSACETLQSAKTVHDELESYYINAMNFSKITEFSADFEKSIFG